METTRSLTPFTSTAAELPAYWLVDVLWVVLASGEQTQGRYTVIEQWMPEGAGPPPHVHAFEDESFWVMEGEMAVEFEDRTVVLGPGTMGHIPRNTAHAFKVTKGVCHVLNYYTPAGFEQAIVGSARPAERREVPPPGLDPTDSPQVVRFFNNYWCAPAGEPWARQRYDRGE